MRNVNISIDPSDMSFFDLPKLLNIDIVFSDIQEGKMPIERTSNIVCADTYCGPIIESITLGATIRVAINGAVKLKPILRLPDDKSDIDADDAGIIIYAILVVKPAATRLTINAR